MCKIRVAICTDGIYPFAMGGMQKHSRLLVESLSIYSELEIYVLHPHDLKLFDGQNINEIFIAPINEKRNYLLETFLYSKRVATTLDKIKPDIIYAQGLTVWYRASQFGKKLIVNPHGLEPYQALGWKENLIAVPFKIIFTRLFGKAAKTVSLGGNLTAILQRHGVGNRKLTVLPNAVLLPDNPAAQMDAPTPVKCLFLARFASNKGIGVLFDAFAILEARGLMEKFQFSLAGKGPLYDYYKKRNTYNNVRLLGFVADESIGGLYSSHNLFVLPTLFEGMPTVVLEAMSYRMPVIVSNVGATAELVDESNGWLIQKNNPLALANALEEAISLSPEQMRSKGQASFEKVKKMFTWPVVAEAHLRVFQELVKVV